MYTNDDSESAALIDRVIAAAIAGLCGYLFGVVFVLLLAAFFGEFLWMKWVVVAAFAIFGFAAPTRSRDMWTRFWKVFLGPFFQGR